MTTKKKKPALKPETPASPSHEESGVEPGVEGRALSGVEGATEVDSQQEAKKAHFPIVGIGASAGGLAALQLFFDNMPSDSGMAFVIIQHLSPDFKSQMNELLSHHTSMAIQKVVDNITLKPNTIYLNASMTQMEVKHMKLLVTNISQKLHVDLPINVFFNSLAHELGEQAVGVILSGTGKDGSEGVRAIHAAGGMVAVQKPETAQFGAMPQSAVDTGICNFILPPGEIPTILLQQIASPSQLPVAAGHDSELPGGEGEYSEIFNLLRREYTLDFSKYKMGTIGRRIQRRMGYRRIVEVPEYAKILSSDEKEIDDLYHDLLIGVTEFFRDEKAFQYLESTVIPEIFAALAPDQDMRAWSAGCATGEEAYSLAILLAEKAHELNFTGKIVVFATDVHKRSLESATQGVFTHEALAKVTPERLKRFFNVVDNNLFKVKADLRKLLTFAQHDLTRDTPFSKLDLICCRNLLIYLNPEAQDKVLSMFQFALKMDGILFLGKSEGTGSLAKGFEALSTQNKIFRKIQDHKYGVDLDSSHKEPLKVIPRLNGQPALSRPLGRNSQILDDYDILLEKHLPPGVLVDGEFNVIHYFDNVSQFLKTPKGRVQTDILSMVEGNLHIALSTALRKVQKTEKSIVTRNIRIKIAKEEHLVDVTIDPIPNEKSTTVHYHIYFERIQKGPVLAPEANKKTDLNTFEPSLYYKQHVEDLALELQSVRADLLATEESLQATSETLNATNEELQAANEELQSTNEELNSSNEELHSTNEELYSVNSEFERSNIELKRLDVDNVNLLTSIDSGIIFLDKEMRIRKFNPAISTFFKLLPQDVGRPIDHIAYQLTDPEELLTNIQSVLSDGVVIEKEVATKKGNWLLKRIMPFKSEEGPKEGVVITFANISKLKEAELKVGRLNEELKKQIEQLKEKSRLLEEETGERIRTMEELQQKDQLLIQQSRLAAMGEMIGNIAHQWRQPLNTLGLYIQSIQMEYKQSDISQEVLDDSVVNTMEIIQHMSQTIDDFREFLTPDKEKKLFKVDEAIKKAVSLTEACLKEFNIVLDINSTGEPQINGFSNEYGQVLLNILMNARDAFGDKRKSHKQITVRSWTEEGRAVVTITDNAGGIKEEILGKIFDAYYSTKVLGKGTGMGLFMSHNIIENSMGGRLSVRNVEGGAEFRIEV